MRYLRILMVEDNPDHAELTTRVLLQEENINEVVLVETGQDCMEKLADGHRFGLILLDYGLPGIDGLSTLRKINKSGYDIPVVMVTGQGNERIAAEAIKTGAYDYVVKSSDYLSVLPAVVIKALKHHRIKKENVRLRENIEQNYLDALAVLISVIEAKDPYTHGHSETVSRYAFATAKEMKLSSREVERIRAAGLLHDIGKIAINRKILLKNGSLTNKERKIIQTHCDSGVKILRPAAFLEELLPIVHQHHEHFDGKGYPQGLKGNEIDLGARILAVADSFEAMTSARSYRPAMSFEKAVDKIKKHAGTQFDPEVVKAFLRTVKGLGIGDQK
ncbi:MAG: response regulator [Desulfobacteraceae bacterium]|uniref:Response regulator n=1 Tax=Candidatus Desulfaltia bathyphila TaxID=2841697 RepID=A0A8J6N5J4_9BACT|nr:response regulator [Candidatus Desulfaltia bathyphila]MBL7195852.1 response regulator [Desulfobacterales bacterium]